MKLRSLIINLTLIFILSSCLTYEKAILNLNQELNSRYNSVFYEKAINAMNIDVNQVDTLYVLERFHDLMWHYDRGVVWTSNGFIKYFDLKTPKKYKNGSPYRKYTGINIIDNDTTSYFDLEIQLLSNWKIKKIHEIDMKRQIITDGSLIAVRLIRKKNQFKGEYVSFSDLREYPNSIKY